MKTERKEKVHFFLTLSFLVLIILALSLFKRAFQAVTPDDYEVIGNLYFDDDITISYLFKDEKEGVVTLYQENNQEAYIFTYVYLSKQKLEIHYQEEQLEFFILKDALLDKTHHVYLRLYEEGMKT